MRGSIDFLSKLETNLFNCILSDFNVLTSIQLHSDKCGLKELQKVEESMRRGNRKVSVQDFIKKTEAGPSSKGGGGSGAV